MRWEKLGKIFDPTDHDLGKNNIGFAQSPQAIVFDDFVRFYYSTRIQDEPGSFLSNISYVDFSTSLNKILANSKDDVIALGGLGSFDEHGIFPISPTVVDDRIIAYTCGWSRRVSVPVETSTGLVESFDGGKTFKRKLNGPVLSSSLNEPMLVGDSFVRKYDNEFHMWYIYGQRWLDATADEPPARVYKINYATSKDGISWDRASGGQTIPDILNEDECQALPSVIYYGGKYHMVFCFRYATDFRINPKRGYRLGYASSDNCQNWERDDSKINLAMQKGEWDGDMMCYPHFFECKGKLYLAYNGNQFGKHGFGLAKLVEN